MCANGLQLLHDFCYTHDDSIITSQSDGIVSQVAVSDRQEVALSDRQEVALVMSGHDGITFQPHDMRMQATSQTTSFRIDLDDVALPTLDLAIGHEVPLADDVPSDEELVEMIVEVFHSYMSRPRLVCSATLESIPRTNLNLDHSKLYLATLQVDGCEKLNAAVIDPGIQSRPFYIDQPLVRLESSITASFNRSRIRARFKEESSIVILERWREIPDETIEILKSLSLGGIVLIDDGEAAFCIVQYIKAGLPRSLPVVMIKESMGEVLLRVCSAKPSRLACKITVETAEERDCSICFEKMDVVMSLPQCGHIIHEQCGLEWLSAQNSCPFCRQDVQDIHRRSNGQGRSL